MRNAHKHYDLKLVWEVKKKIKSAFYKSIPTFEVTDFTRPLEKSFPKLDCTLNLQVNLHRITTPIWFIVY